MCFAVFMSFMPQSDAIISILFRYGNLQENIPWLIIMFCLCIMPQQGTVLYLYLAAFVSFKQL